MDCASFENLLDRLCDGTAGDADRAAAEMHARSCRGCARLLRLARGEEEILAPDAGTEFVRSVLEVTSGQACARAREMLTEAPDGLEPRRARMLEGHAGHCADCRAFATTMQMLQQVLPGMAEMDPGPAFASAVLRAVRTVRPAAARRLQFGAIWERLVKRPLFAWEAAYAGTVLFALVFLNPLLPVRDASIRALSSVQSQAASVAGTAPAEFASVGNSIREVSSRTAGAIQSASLRVAQKVNRSILKPVRGNLRRFGGRGSPRTNAG